MPVKKITIGVIIHDSVSPDPRDRVHSKNLKINPHKVCFSNNWISSNYPYEITIRYFSL